MGDPHHLRRFLDAQASVYEEVVGELRAGQKQSHWMWFVFPQVKGLGYSATAIEFGIASAAEAKAYLEHSVLGSRLKECTQLVLKTEGRTVQQIFGYPDYLKFRSCMTLFSQVAADEPIFGNALAKFFDGKPDTLTLGLLRQ